MSDRSGSIQDSHQYFWPRSVLKHSRLFHTSWECSQLPRSVCTPPGVMSELALWMTTCSVHSIVSSLSVYACVCLTCCLTWPIMHGILPIPIIRKGNVYFPGQLYVQSPENIVKQSSKFSSFGTKPLIGLLEMKQLYLLIRYSMWLNNLCVAWFFDALLLMNEALIYKNSGVYRVKTLPTPPVCVLWIYDPGWG